MGRSRRRKAGLLNKGCIVAESKKVKQVPKTMKKHNKNSNRFIKIIKNIPKDKKYNLRNKVNTTISNSDTLVDDEKVERLKSDIKLLEQYKDNENRNPDKSLSIMNELEKDIYTYDELRLSKAAEFISNLRRSSLNPEIASAATKLRLIWKWRCYDAWDMNKLSLEVQSNIYRNCSTRLIYNAIKRFSIAKQLEELCFKKYWNNRLNNLKPPGCYLEHIKSVTINVLEQHQYDVLQQLQTLQNIPNSLLQTLIT